MHHRHECIEQVPGIVRAGCRLGMILHAESLSVGQPEALYRFIVQIDMCYLGIAAFFYIVGRNAKTVILGGDFGLTRLDV